MADDEDRQALIDVVEQSREHKTFVAHAVITGSIDDRGAFIIIDNGAFENTTTKQGLASTLKTLCRGLRATKMHLFVDTWCATLTPELQAERGGREVKDLPYRRSELSMFVYTPGKTVHYGWQYDGESAGDPKATWDPEPRAPHENGTERGVFVGLIPESWE